MTAPTVHDPEVAEYLRDVRAELDDLPADERDELLEGLEADLTELRAEEGGSLTDRLGTPQAYAAELRSAAGLPPHEATPTPTVLDRLRTAVGPLKNWAEAAPGLAALRRLLPELRPGWWVLRGYLVAWLVCMMLGSGGVSGPFPRFGDSVLVGLLLAVGAIALSVWVGRRTGRRRWVSRAVLLTNLVVAFMTLVALLDIQERYAQQEATYYWPVSGELAGPNGRITDIRPYDRDGRPLSDVQLYDQNGIPIDLEGPNAYRYRPDGTTWGNVFPQFELAPGEYAGPVQPLGPAPTPSVTTPVQSPGAPTPSVSTPLPSPSN
jgi:hypothetical protein